MSQNIKTNLFYSLAVISLATLIITSVIYAWTEPSLAPPDGNVSAPINAGDTAQIKTGPLQVNGFRNIGDTIFDGTVGIGTTIPTTALTMGADKSFRLIGGASFPASPNEGEIFFRTDNKQLYTYASSTWQADRTIASKIVAASNSLNKEKADYVCDGTDDQEQIQKAIDDLGSKPGAVYLLEGIYNISGAIYLDNTAPDDSGKAIIGAGKGTVLQIATGETAIDVINAQNVNNIIISQLMINGNETSGEYNWAIVFDTVAFSKINKVWIRQDKSEYGIYLTSSSNNTITNNTIQENAADIYLYSSSNNLISANTADSIKLSDSSNNNIITANIILDYVGVISIKSSSYNTISANALHCSISLSSSSNNLITSNTISGSGGSGIHSTESNNNIIAANTISGSGGDGIEIYGPSSNNNIITGNTIYENGLSGGGNGIRIEDDSDNNIISSNRIYDSVVLVGPVYGIYVKNNTADNNYFTGNFIDGAGFANPINDLGTGTKYTDKTKMTLEKKTISTSGNYTLDAAASPQTYISFNPTGAITLALANGKAAGDLLILENINAANSVTLSESANVNLGAASRVLGQYDALDLIWNGSKWLEMKWSDN